MSEVSNISIREGIKSETDILKGQMWQALEAMDNRHLPSQERVARQKEIIDNLPDDFKLEMKAFSLSPEVTSQNKESILAGNLFEELVRADKNICSGETPLAKTIRTFMHMPDRYGLEKYGINKGVSNPDIAVINEQGQISGWTEAKTGLLDESCLKQLRNFKNSFKQTLLKLKEIKDDQILINLGLEEIAKNKEKLEISNKLDLKLAVPYDSYNNNPYNLIDSELRKEDRDKLVEILTNDYIPVESPFSRKEITTLTRLLVQVL